MACGGITRRAAGACVRIVLQSAGGEWSTAGGLMVVTACVRIVQRPVGGRGSPGGRRVFGQHLKRMYGRKPFRLYNGLECLIQQICLMYVYSNIAVREVLHVVCVH